MNLKNMKRIILKAIKKAKRKEKKHGLIDRTGL